MNFQDLISVFNQNLKHIKRELNSWELAALKKEYNAEDDSHLAKILSIRGIKLYA